MKTIQLFLLMSLMLKFGSGFSQQHNEKLILTAKFMKQKLEQMNLNNDQWEQFYVLSKKLRADLNTLREEAGISDLIRKRDEVYREMLKEGVPKEKQFEELGKRMQLTPKQLQGFMDTPALKENYKEAVKAHLTKEQQAKLKTLKGKKTKKHKS